MEQMRDTHGKKWDAINFENGIDMSEGEEWNVHTYVSANEENEFGISILEEDDME